MWNAKQRANAWIGANFYTIPIVADIQLKMKSTTVRNAAKWMG